MAGRLSEWWQGLTVRNAPVFTSARRRLTSVTVRGDQMADELGGVCLRTRYFSDGLIRSAPALVWIVEADAARWQRYERWTPQILDVVNPGDATREAVDKGFDRARFFLLNTEASREYLGTLRDGACTWVVPHHHCNTSGFQLPEARLERPRVVGYLGQPVHLHDAEVISKTVRELGLDFRSFADTDLTGYQSIDIGIAWTRPDVQRARTRSNIKYTNFAAHGIPCIASDYESYRDVDARCGPVGRLAGTLEEFLDGLREMASSESLRRTCSANGQTAYRSYSRESIGAQYREIITQVQADFSANGP
ncbi:MAG: hypothetical protein SFX74_00555 [Fimbriimonadaceae bacterium]|nr:hypothetical protein [Fimbriimonadaceae bacterium]